MRERRVYFWHLKALGFCNRQMRVWCRQHSVSWLELRTQGIDADLLLALDDGSMAHQAVEFAESTGWSPVAIAGDDGGPSGSCV